MEAFNIVVGVSNIVNCVTGICTLGTYQKNQPCDIITYLDVSKEQLLTAYQDLASYARDLGTNAFQELEKGCNELRETLDETVAATPPVANANYFVKKKKYRKLLEDAHTLKTNTYNMIVKIRNQSAAARNAERQRIAQREGPYNEQPAQSANKEQDSNRRNPFSDEATVVWQGHEHSA